MLEIWDTLLYYIYKILRLLFTPTEQIKILPYWKILKEIIIHLAIFDIRYTSNKGPK